MPAPPDRAAARRQLISKAVAELAPSPIRRFFGMVQAMPHAISLSIGEPDFVTPWRVREQAIFSLERGATHYTPTRGIPELLVEISRYLERRFGLHYDPQTQLLITAGVSEGLDLALRALLDPGDTALLPEPCYVSYAPCVSLAAGRIRFLPTTHADGFRLRPDALREALAQPARLLLMGYPNNPTGVVLAESDLKDIAAVSVAHDLFVVVDEIYAELTYGSTHKSIAAQPGMMPRTLVLGGFSKGFAMTGWRLGWAAGPPEVIEAMARIHSYTMLCCAAPTQLAALEALRSGDDDVKDMVRQYDQRRRLVLKRLADMGLPAVEPRGAFYVFPDISALGLPDVEFAERLLAEQAVAVIPGSAFGPSGAGHVRLCYATAMPQIEEALKRISAFITSLR